MISGGVLLVAGLALAPPATSSEQPGVAATCLTVDRVASPAHDDRFVVSGSSRCRKPLALFLAVRTDRGQAWRVLPQRTTVGASGHFAFDDVVLGGAQDGQARFHLIALGVEPGDGLAPEWHAHQSLMARAAATSASSAVARTAAPQSREIKAEVRFDRLDGREISGGPTVYDVALEAFAEGHVHRPADAVVQCVVQPIGSDGRYVMHGGFGYDDQFDCAGHFGRGPGFDLFERFFLTAVVARPRLDPDRGEYSAEEWRRLGASGHILAESSPVRTRRTIEVPGGQAGMSVAILRINGEEVIGAGVLRVRQTASVEGNVDGGLASHRVAVYVREDVPHATWRRLGPTLSTDSRRWQLLPAQLGEPDRRVVMVAIRYQGLAPDLNRNDDSAHIVAHSALVRAVINEPALEINYVGGRVVGAEAGTRREMPLRVGAVARIEGAKADGSGADIAVYARPAAGTGRWKRLALLSGAVGPRWETGDLLLGAPGAYVVAAASGSSAAEPNELPSGPGVRLTNPVYVKVEER